MTPLERAAYGLNWQVDHQRRVAVICDALTDYLSNKAGGPGGGDADLCGGVALFLAAIFAHEAGLPLGVAVEGITHKLARMFADIEAKGAMPPHDVKKNMRAATEAACAKLAELYGDETQGPGAGSLSPGQFGILVADYHYSKGSTDELFQRGLTAALEAGAEAWRAQGEGEDEMDQKTDLMLDASLRHWFRLTGRAVRSL